MTEEEASEYENKLQQEMDEMLSRIREKHRREEEEANMEKLVVWAIISTLFVCILFIANGNLKNEITDLENRVEYLENVKDYYEEQPTKYN